MLMTPDHVVSGTEKKMKTAILTTMLRPKTYTILVDAVENGVRYGMNRAYKHSDDPPKDHIAQEVETAVINEILEWFMIDDGDGDDYSNLVEGDGSSSNNGNKE